MAGFEVPNLAYLRNIPVIGARLYEAFHGAQKAINTMAVQGNLNPTGPISPPPALQSVNASGKDGVLTVSIEHTAADVRRGVRYYVEHADNPSFINPQVRQIGDSRSFSEFVGSQQRWVRAYAAYPGSDAGPSAYHGGGAIPQPVDAGGSVGAVEYQPSQGSGTGAPGQGGVGPGPIQVRTDSSGFDWRLQRPITGGGFGPSAPSQAGIGSAGDSGGSGGGGGGIVPQPLLVNTHASRLASYPSVKYPVNTEFYESDRTCWYWVQNATGTVTVTTGTTVTWNTGNHFVNTGSGFTAGQWPAGTQIIINGVTCLVSSVSSSTVLTLQSATTNAGPVSYVVPSGRWVYLSGQYAAALASIPVDLGENDTILVSSKVANGFLFYENAAFAHQVQWNVSTWQRGPNDEDRADSFHSLGHVVSDIGWYPCDGTSTTYFDYATPGTPVARTVPNSDGTAAYEKGGNSYSATIASAATPTASAPTFTGAALTPSGSVSAPVFTGDAVTITTDLFTPVALATAAVTSIDGSITSYTPSGSVSAPSFTGSPVTPTGTVSAPVITLPGDPLANFPVVRMYRR